MNDTTKPLANPAHEREWQAQERAVHAERTHAAANADDARSREYRLIARALSEAPADALPEDFAASVARQALAEQRMPASEPFTSPFERHLLQLLVAVFGVAFLGEKLSWVNWLGIVMIGAGAWLVTLAV